MTFPGTTTFPGAGLLVGTPPADGSSPNVGTLFTYRPADPASATAVTLVELFATPSRSSSPVAQAGPAVRSADGSAYSLRINAPDGTYFPAITVTYADGSTVIDDDGPSLRLPAARIAQPGDPLDPWVSVAELQADPRLATVPATTLAECAQAATEVLWALSGRQFPGPRASTERLAPQCPCGRRRWWPAPEGSRLSTLDRGTEAGYSWGGGSCMCGQGLLLPHRPVRQVTAVTWQGIAVTDWTLEGGRLFFLAPTAVTLPTPTSDPGGRSLLVTLVYGQDPPAAGRRAARALASAYARGQKAGGCGIPSRTTSVAAEGVTVLLDDLDTYRQGGTGVTEADAWVAAVNPGRAAQPAGVLSPDGPRWRSR